MSSTQSPHRERREPAIVVFGPAGCGKTTIGRRVAERLGARFVDADDFHSSAAVEKMRAGIGLSDADRKPWLQRLAEVLHEKKGPRPVLACSALRESYRKILAGEGPEARPVLFVYLDVPPEVLARRLKQRSEHFAGSSLLASQLQTLERPQTGIVDATAPLEQVVDQVCAWVRQARRDLPPSRKDETHDA